MKRIIILITALLLSSQAQAIRISAVGDSFTVDWRKNMSRFNSHTGNLTATSTWLVNSYSSNRIVIDISVTNTTAPSTGIMANSGITRFGFNMLARNTGSALTGGSVFNSLYSGWGMQLLYPNNRGNKLKPGATDSLQLHLTGNFGKAVNLNLFRMNSKVNNRNFMMPGKATKNIRPASCLAAVNGNCTTANVPEPAVVTLVLLGLAMIAGTGTLRRRKRQTVTLQA